MPFLFNAEVMASAESDIEDILDRIDVPDGGRILDVGCGIGRLLIPLVRAGYQVVGLDVCDLYRRRLRALGAKAGLELDVRAKSAFELSSADLDPVDLVLDVFAVLGYCEDPVGDVRAVRGFLECLRPGGQVVIETRNPRSPFGSYKHSATGGYCIEKRQFDRQLQLLETQWTITAGGRQRVHRSRVRLYSPEDIEGLLEVCGFESIRVLDHPHLERILTIGTRPNQGVQTA
jgi:SAM-dependent methyltransferase